LRNYFREPYPLRRTLRTDLLFILGSGLFVSGFLIIFQPGDTYTETDPNKNLFLAGYGVITVVVLAFMRFGLPRLWPRLFRESGWTVGKHLIWLLVSFSIVIICSFVYLNWYFGYTFYWSQFWYFAGIAASIGIFPLTAFVLIDYIRQLRLHSAGAEVVNAQRPEAAFAKKRMIVTFPDEQGDTQLEVPADQVYYIGAAMNYVEIHYRTEDQMRREIIRNTLKKVEGSLASPPFMRVHRSYVVNVEQVREVTGNAQGYHLHLDGIAEPIPVSRSRSKEVLGSLGGRSSGST